MNKLGKVLSGACIILLFAFLSAGCSARNENQGSTSETAANSTPAGIDNAGSNKQEMPEITGLDASETENNTVTDAIEDESAAEEIDKAPEREFTVVLDPGHGGSFSGAAYDGRVEKKLTLKIAEYAAEYIRTNASDVSVFMTRTDDSIMSEDVVKDLELRAEFAKEKGADIFVSMHLNAADKHDQNGGMVLISHRANVTDASAALGRAILSEISALGIKDRGLVTRNSSDHFDEDGNPLEYYAINRHCANRDIPGIIVEHCFIDGSVDADFLDTEEDLKLLGEADARGILAYLETLK